jgi:CHAT domain-containing protein/Tfp pilus assembly protein PilF
MLALAPIALTTSLLLFGQQAPTAFALARDARAQSDSSLMAIARQQPDTVRAAMSELQLLAVAGGGESAAEHLLQAGRIASAYARAWSDSFPLRQLARFTRWSQSERQAKVTLDSLRRAGAEVLATEGIGAAMLAWSESLRLARAIGDSAGESAALGNLGVALYREGELDSASVLLARARDGAARIGDNRTRVNAVGALAGVHLARGEVERAKAGYVEALSLRGLTGDDRGAASDENNLGLIALEQRDTVQARFRFESALDRNRRAGRHGIVAQNLSNLASLAVNRGEYAAAHARYSEVVRLHRERGEKAFLGPALRDLALLQLRRGDYASARSLLDEAALILDETGPAFDAALTHASLATAYSAMGDLQSALVALRDAERAAAAAPQGEAAAHVALVRADVAVSFNAISDAARDYEEAARLFASVGDVEAQAEALQGTASVALHREDWRGAERLLDRIMELRVDLGDRHAMATTMLLLGYCFTAQGRFADAEAELVEARDVLRESGDVVGETTAIGLMADVELARGRPAQAAAAFRSAIARLAGTQTRVFSVDLRRGLAAALTELGNPSAAATQLRLAAETVERSARPLRAAGRRAAFRASRMDLYDALALLEFRLRNISAAYQVSERLRARAMLENVASARVSMSEVGDSSLVAREQDLRRRISALENDMDYASGGGRSVGQGDAPPAERIAELHRAQDEYAEILNRLTDLAPHNENLLNVAPAPVAAVQALLTSNQALVEYLVTDSTTLVFVVRHNALHSLDLGVNRRTLAAAVDFTRELLAPGAPDGNSGAEPWRPPLRRLHRLLIEPLEKAGLLAGVSSLVLAPHAELHYLPFAALIQAGVRDRFLVERFELRSVPSATVWVAQSRSEKSVARSGVLALAPLPSLFPASRREADAVAAALGGGSRVLTGSSATEQMVRDSIHLFEVVHFATLGVLNKRSPLFSHVRLSPANRDDGLLNVHEIFGLRINARLVTLSACETGLGAGVVDDVPAGDDWIGLSRAFMHAGARNVMATLWPIEDRAAERVMAGFYRRLRSAGSLTAALAAAQREALSRPETAHPATWSAFVLVGDGL